MKSLFLPIAYIQFLRKSTNEHGVHSPFVFALVTKCFYDRAKYTEYEVLRDYRKRLASNKKTINVTDFGAGSNVFKSDIRVVADIARHAGITRKRAELLFRVVQYFKPENVLELGTSLGLATTALSLGNPEAHILTLEGCTETADIAAQNLAHAKLGNVTIETGEFSNTLSKITGPQHDDFSNSGPSDFQAFKPSDLQTSKTLDFIYFDGNHQKEATLDYFRQLLPTAGNDTVWIFDDIHWSKGMEEAWEIIKQHPKVTVTIDTFQWGFVFFRKEQAKEHFTIRV